jgi:hypothetical protein
MPAWFTPVVAVESGQAHAFCKNVTSVQGQGVMQIAGLMPIHDEKLTP